MIGIDAIKHYVAMRKAMPLNTLGDSVHSIHAGTEFAAELKFSDLALAIDEIARLEAPLATIADEANWGSDGGWDGASYPDEIARNALAMRK
jgi:hypothetical protein